MLKSICVAAVIFSAVAPSMAFADECSNAVEDYNNVLAKLNDATQKFSACVAGSLGLHDCSTQFKELRMIDGQYEASVAVYLKQCL